MFNLGYYKGQPTDYVFKYTGGKLRSEGQSLAFFYWKHATQIVVVPTCSQDASFVFKELTRGYQEVTIQGQFTYRVSNPQQVAQLLNYAIEPGTRAYTSSDPDRLTQRLTNIIQTTTRGELRDLSLEDVLGQFVSIAAVVEQNIKSSNILDSLGVQLMSLFFTSARPTPEVAKALEADYREALLRKADEAVSARRAAAVFEERKIKENELNTEIALEEQRRRLLDLQGENTRVEAEAQAQAFVIKARSENEARQEELKLYRELDPRLLTAVALYAMGQNADRIGNLTITPDILATVLAERSN